MKKNISQKNVIILRSTSIKNDSRVTKESITISKYGYNVRILGWDRDGFLKDNENIIDGKITIPVNVFKVKSGYGLGVKSLFKLIKFQFWLLYCLFKERKNIDIIHSCDFDTAVPASIIAKIFKKKLVYDIFDYYIDSHKVPEKLKNIIEKMEINIINKANLTIICTDERKEQIKKANPKKCIVIYNTPDILEYDINKQVIKNDTNKLKIAYVGILQESRLLKEIGEEIKKHKEIELHIGGFGNLENYFEELSENYENVFYYGKMKYEDVLRLEKDCNILFATYDSRIENHKYSAPNKLYEAMALGKPIVVCRNTGIDKIVEKYKIGLSINYDVREFIDSVIYISKNSNMFENIQRIYNDKYAWNIMEERLMKEYKEL